MHTIYCFIVKKGTNKVIFILPKIRTNKVLFYNKYIHVCLLFAIIVNCAINNAIIAIITIIVVVAAIICLGHHCKFNLRIQFHFLLSICFIFKPQAMLKVSRQFIQIKMSLVICVCPIHYLSQIKHEDMARNNILCF